MTHNQVVGDSVSMSRMCNHSSLDASTSVVGCERQSCRRGGNEKQIDVTNPVHNGRSVIA